MKNRHEQVKEEILRALAHPEAEDGLYLRNFRQLHEEDQRPAVAAEEEEIIQALNELVTEGKVHLDQSSEEVVFELTAKGRESME